MIRIVIIEDQEEVRDLISLILSNNKDIEIVAMFSNGKSARKEIPILKPDIALVDIGLPDISGIEVIKHIKITAPEVDIMVWSVFNDETNILEALKFGASSYVLKTANAEFIINSIKELAAGGSPMSPEIARVLINKFFLTPNYSKKTISAVTARELEVLIMLSKGYLYKEIAIQMDISVNTLKTHCYNIYQKLHVSNKIEAINRLFDENNLNHE